MSLIFPILVVIAVVLFFVLKRLSFVSAKQAVQLLQEGAAIVDVRSEDEFKSGSVAGAVNIPLGTISIEAPRQLPDKSRPLLLHCLSGGRSGIARGQFKRMGYTNVFNLGSFGRADQIVRESRKS